MLSDFKISAPFNKTVAKVSRPSNTKSMVVDILDDSAVGLGNCVLYVQRFSASDRTANSLRSKNGSGILYKCERRSYHHGLERSCWEIKHEIIEE
jgi:hypothetical protein